MPDLAQSARSAKGLAPALLASLLVSSAVGAEGFLAQTLQDFDNSAFVFPRSGSNVPFPPLAYLGTSHYGDTEVEASGRGAQVSYDLTTVAQAAGIPFVIGERDALIVGDYLSWSRFRLQGETEREFEVGTLGLPVGWLRQVNPRWQAAAFVMPMAHRATLDESAWSWQTMGGVFARFVQHERLWWAFGAYADVAPGDDFYVPYVGASWAIDDHWTLSGIMPWPAVLYAPDPDWLFRLGLSPSGASWSFDPQTGGEDVSMNLDAWDFGLSVERRIAGGLAAAVEAGVGGLRGWRLDGSRFEDFEIEASSSAYLRIDLKFRPGAFTP